MGEQSITFLLVVITFTQVFGDYNFCVNNGGIQWQGDCFKLHESVSGMTYSESEQACHNDGGRLAPLLVESVRSAILEKMNDIGLANAWLAIRQRFSQPSPSEGWYFLNTETNGVLDATESEGPLKIPFAFPNGEPNDWASTGGKDFETNSQNHVTLDRAKKAINDKTHTDRYGALCQYELAGHHLFGQPMHGFRLTSPVIESLDGVENAVRCALSCHKSSFCCSFSYSKTQKKCDHHCVGPNSPGAVVEADDEFSFYESMDFE